MRFFVVLCVLLAFEAARSAVVLKRDVSAKTKEDEDAYGALDESDGDVQKDGVEYYDEDEDVEEAPANTGGSNNVDVKLISKPESFVQELGDVVRFPCLVSSKDGPIRMWSKDSTPIYQGQINIGNKNNYDLFDNGTLEVVLEVPDDFGTYSCKLVVSESIQPEVVHSVIQRTSPTITELFANDNKKVFDIGDTLVLTCRATGYPKPRISWHKNNERLGTEGETLTIQSVKAKHSGSYRCLADNGIDRPNHQHIEIYVNHAPMVSVEDYMVNTDHELDAELVCEVKAYPSAVVNWQRDGKNIAARDNKIELQRHRDNERNILIIKKIEERDFGQYTCTASNSFGKQEKTVHLVRTPAVGGFDKHPSKESVKDVILQWRVESKQPISGHELQYRRKGETSWKTITPEVGEADNDVYLIEHTLKNLESGTYETRARSKNSHGWSDYSEIIPFEGDPSNTPAQHRSEEITAVGESTSSSTSLSTSINLLALLLLILHVRQ